MALLENIRTFFGRTAETLASFVKILLLSRSASAAAKADARREIVILGNGPSLRGLIDESRAWLDGRSLLAVNFAANTPEFFDLRPEYYVLADPLLFRPAGNANVEKLWKNLSLARHEMTLFVPVKQRMLALALLKGNRNVRVKTFNMTPADGYGFFRRAVYASGLGMPRPRNVLIPSIMLAIGEGFGRIYLAGADHSWSRTLYVTDENLVVNTAPHFYKDNEKETRRILSDYKGLHLHQILESMSIAFRSYFTILDYARRRGVEIVNITPDSFIDAFPKSHAPKD